MCLRQGPIETFADNQQSPGRCVCRGVAYLDCSRLWQRPNLSGPQRIPATTSGRAMAPSGMVQLLRLKKIGLVRHNGKAAKSAVVPADRVLMVEQDFSSSAVRDSPKSIRQSTVLWSPSHGATRSRWIPVLFGQTVRAGASCWICRNRRLQVVKQRIGLRGQLRRKSQGPVGHAHLWWRRRDASRFRRQSWG